MVIILDICKNRENNYSKQIFHNKTGSRARVCQSGGKAIEENKRCMNISEYATYHRKQSCAATCTDIAEYPR